MIEEAIVDLDICPLRIMGESQDWSVGEKINLWMEKTTLIAYYGDVWEDTGNLGWLEEQPENSAGGALGEEYGFPPFSVCW